MAKKKIKNIVLCQGDKKELEEMTGYKYEYVNMCQDTDLHRSGFGRVKDSYISDLNRCLGKFKYSIMPTFLEVAYGSRLGVPDTNSWDNVRKLMYHSMDNIGADALIHYKESITNGFCPIEDSHDGRSFCSHGTPVRKIK